MKRIFFFLITITFIFNCTSADKDQAYQDYLKKCTQASEIVAEHLGSIRDLAKIVQDYNWIPYDQWQKNSQELIEASNRGDLKKVKELLENEELDVNAKNKSDSTALMRAVARKHKAVVELLLQANADVNAKENSGSTALFIAVAGNQKEIVELLINSKANVNEQNNRGYTALMLAAAQGHKDIVEMLINANADINAQDKDGENALAKANRWKNNEILELLKKAGAES